MSYKIIGIAFQVGKEVGFGHKEKFYQKALVIALKSRNIKFKEQLPARIKFKGDPLGIYYFDFFS